MGAAKSRLHDSASSGPKLPHATGRQYQTAFANVGNQCTGGKHASYCNKAAPRNFEPRLQDSLTAAGRLGTCAGLRPAIIRATISVYGNKNWIGGLERHPETGQGHDETRERRLRRPLL